VFVVVFFPPSTKFIGAIEGVVVLEWPEAIMMFLNHPQIFVV
jgi:hypothetical protein